MEVDLSFKGEITTSELLNTLQGNKSKIISLNLEYSTISEGLLHLLVDIFPELSNIQSVSLQDISPDFSDLNKRTVLLFIKHLLQVKSLVQLNLQGCNLCEEMTKQILFYMTTNIRWISLIDNPLTPDELIHLVGFRVQMNINKYIKECEIKDIERKKREKQQKLVNETKETIEDQVKFFEEMENLSAQKLKERKLQLEQDQLEKMKQLEEMKRISEEKQIAFMAKLNKKKKKKKK